MKAPRWMLALLGCGAVIIFTLLGLNIYMAIKPAPKPLIEQSLTNLLPAAPVGWKSQDQPIASTPEEQEQVESVLHFDDAVYRTYDNGQTQIGVYIAHWLPGKYSPAKVGSHSPITCWVHNGWDSLAWNQGVEQTLAGDKLKPMDSGVFQKDHEKINVIFWHLVGGVPVHYDLVGWQNGLAGRIERLPALVADFSRFGLDQRKEQLVIRLSSTQPFDQLWADPGFIQLMSQLSRNFDLYAQPSRQDQALHASIGGTQTDVVRTQ